MRSVSSRGAAVLALCLSSAAASAATLHDVSISRVTGEWVTADPYNAYGVDISTTPERTQVSWGMAPTGGAQSAYEFEGIVPGAVTPGTHFDLGLFTHLNNPIYTYPGHGFTTAITQAQLKVDFDVRIGGQDYFLSKIFTFLHDETPNEGGFGGACAYGGTSGVGADANGCRDRVVIADSLDTTESLVIDGMEYVFSLSGFKVGGQTVDYFLTEEQSINEAFLVGSYTVSQVPLPAAGWLLLAGVGGLAAMKRRKSKSEARV